MIILLFLYSMKQEMHGERPTVSLCYCEESQLIKVLKTSLTESHPEVGHCYGPLQVQINGWSIAEHLGMTSLLHS